MERRRGGEGRLEAMDVVRRVVDVPRRTIGLLQLVIAEHLASLANFVLGLAISTVGVFHLVRERIVLWGLTQKNETNRADLLLKIEIKPSSNSNWNLKYIHTTTRIQFYLSSFDPEISD